MASIKVGIGTLRAYYREQPVYIIQSNKRKLKCQLATYDEAKMSESTSRVFKPLTWLLLLALIAVIALSGWYISKLKQQVAGRDQTIEQTELQVRQANERLNSATKEETRLKQRIEELEAEHQSEVQVMTGKLDDADRANATLQSELGQLQKSHAKTLEAERQKASGAIAALQAGKDVSDQRVNELEGEIERLNLALMDATKQHKAEMAGALAAFEMHQANQEKEVVERIEHYRAALKGNKPELAAQLSALDERIESDAQALRRAANRIKSLETARTDLKEQLEIVTQNLDAKSQALAQTRQELEAQQNELVKRQQELEALRAEPAAYGQQGAGKIAALESQLANAKTEATQAQANASALLAKTKHEAAAELEATQAAAAVALEKAKADAAAALKRVQTQYAAQIDELKTRTAALDQELGAERSRFAKVQSELASKNKTLSETEESLAQVKIELRKTREQASLNKTTLEGEVVKTRGKISELEQALVHEREQAAQEKAALQQDNREAVAYVRAMFSDMSALGGRMTENGMLFNLGNEQLLFRIDSAKLPDRDFPVLDQLAELLTKYPELNVRIEGHTDNRGRDETNLQLSQQRAETVLQELADRGVSTSRMEAVGIGPVRPIADNETPYGRALNRRVGVYVIAP